MGPAVEPADRPPETDETEDGQATWVDGLTRAAWSGGRRLFRAHFGIDVRALAAFRIGLGAVLVLGTLLRARNLRAFYTDAGVVPRTTLAELNPLARTISVHAWFGSPELQAVLFSIALVAALCVLVGYRTRTATLVSLVLVLSVQGRNPFILNGGDILLRHLLFWALLLPLGERWAIDARRRSGPARDRVASLATAGLLLQVLVVYGVNAVLKHRSVLWQRGTALEYIYNLDQFTVLLGDVVADLPTLLAIGGRLWVWLLTLSWLLVVLRGWPRAIFAAMFVVAHLAMMATMSLDVFPLVSVVALLPFVPGVAWDVVERCIATHLTNEGAGFGLPVTPLSRVQSRGWTIAVGVDSGQRRRLLSILAGVALLAMLMYNVATVVEGGVGPPGNPDLVDGEPHWNMFAPHPPQATSWNLVTGTLETGKQVDALHGGSLGRDRPPDEPTAYLSTRWRKYFQDLRRPGQTEVLGPSLATYLCERWNDRHQTELESLRVTHVLEHVDLDGPDRTERRRVGRWACSP